MSLPSLWDLLFNLKDAKSISRAPKASNEKEFMEYEGRRIEIRRRSRIRSLSLKVFLDGRIRVSSNKTTSQKLIYQFLLANKEWLRSRTEKFDKMREKVPQKQFQEGETYLVLGREFFLKILKSSKRKKLSYLSHNNLVVEIAADCVDEDQEIAQEIRKFYEREGKRVLSDRVNYLVEITGLRPAQIRFRAQNSRWGSCTAEGNINLNWKLLVAPLEVIDYVILHELCHLKHLNHSKSFWALVAKHCLNYKQLGKWLGQHQLQFDFLAKIIASEN